MKPIILVPILLLAGLAVGSGSAVAVRVLLPAAPPAANHAAPKVETSFTPTGKILAPLVSADGRLSGYVLFDVQLETSAEDVEFVTPRLPILLNAINMRTFRAPMASGPDGMLPNLEVFRKIVIEASNEAFGRGVVRRAAITQAAPA
ncbi:hypothetical protein WSK_2754 [Novosphingobium sp. Rr 2-17]|uniref:hypothetical protein n=1 Tax=Novosphingobium sp. Rr 2-17 TaxID=555793 RepID=UPI0002699218|nr:hypothetical protein [Novosphingobium sp. Rr 2-17]EIZ78706.1 hypothetical protein WSK_2754 [Novosphingobium sp. Rr 2-17]